MTGYNQGRVFEYLVRDVYKKNGFTVIRSAGSKSPIDLMAWKEKEGEINVDLIQCKKETKKKNYKDDVIEMSGVQCGLGWRKVLWVKHGRDIAVYEVIGVDVVLMGMATLKELKEFAWIAYEKKEEEKEHA
jgi:hypothetical protein